MHYYEVLVAHLSYHGNEALTYSSAELLAPGALVRISLRQRTVLGLVVREVPKPVFAAKSIDAVAPVPPLPAASLELLQWLRTYYPSPLGAAVRLFVPPTTVLPKSNATVAQSNQKILDTALPPLTADQQHALEIINGPGTFLLHGITGSGKSRVYIELARRCLASGRSALVLTPEIGLTAQLTETFRAVFGDSVVVLHSRLTAAERRDNWLRLAAQTKPLVVIGPRSALFSPLGQIGLIVVDEAHDDAYKNESAPHYRSSRVAAKLAQLHQATLVSGSATPSVEDYFVATQKGRPIVTMDHLAKAGVLQPVTMQVVDWRDHAAFSRSSVFSDLLLAAITGALGRGEQTLLFLNRRGTANAVLCNQCGWQAMCPNCDLPLTYHGDEHRIRCHECGFTSLLASTCPQCGNTDILLKTIGTKAVLDEARRLFPSAQLQRFDTDLTKTERLEQHISALQAGSADIIVGTQMIAKGLDLPKLSVVGLVHADTGLLIPDYTAAEHTYQLLTQVAGRVGRGHRPGTVVMQSYRPDNPTLVAAMERQWPEFYEAEISERQTYRFPPFCYLLKLNCLRATAKSAVTAAERLANTIRTSRPNVRVEGPAPAFHPRQQGRYNWQLTVKAARRADLIAIIHALPSGWNYDIDPVNLL